MTPETEDFSARGVKLVVVVSVCISSSAPPPSRYSTPSLRRHFRGWIAVEAIEAVAQGLLESLLISGARQPPEGSPMAADKGGGEYKRAPAGLSLSGAQPCSGLFGLPPRRDEPWRNDLFVQGCGRVLRLHWMDRVSCGVSLRIAEEGT